MREDTQRARAWSSQLLATHDRLRAAVALTRAQLQDGESPTTPGVDLHTYCVGFCAALSGHHRAEDRGLFPAVAQARPALADALSALMSDHAQLETLLDSLRAALAGGDPPGALLRHLDGVQAVMESHFAYEERLLLTVLETLDVDAEPGDLLGPLA